MDLFDFDHCDEANKIFLDPTAGTVVLSVPEGNYHY
jgi:hypothetical protein